MSSPRTWGCFFCGPAHSSAGGVFPTHVGVFLKHVWTKAPDQSLPHARGGVSMGAHGDGGQVWSSPRTWGCFSQKACISISASVFPTHVGVFPECARILTLGRCLPHARGGVSFTPMERSFCVESSPRTWGCFYFGVAQRRRRVVFPTHVGVFLRRLIAVMISGSLPHARGGVSGIHDAPYQRGHSFCLHHVRGVFLVRGLPALAYWSLPYTCGT